eukprot:CAMPEP_0203908536 /NCGR_PEP_ID=MMETSP0359-20131031/49908_1 /ASSEMBLY_ACC=CAM_ASM_000338 /TAXON_ID=268821 /ORGANISM="Scrippsiella Hangoei, Strain SHTV-5" /LENGTH=76 /DNA_ID=CAMNT_0050833563 /DNA_START=42 /DNA_END=272 /DNA_ORIENTATION=+
MSIPRLTASTPSRHNCCGVRTACTALTVSLSILPSGKRAGWSNICRTCIGSSCTVGGIVLAVRTRAVAAMDPQANF